jgi:hypothetical protein
MMLLTRSMIGGCMFTIFSKCHSMTEGNRGWRMHNGMSGKGDANVCCWNSHFIVARKPMPGEVVATV